MFNFHLSYKWLYFSKPSGPPHPVPEGLQRAWIETSTGRLEILYAEPEGCTSKPPVFFCHGGMGGAWVWTEYMQYLAARGVACYAISLRGHGDSWYPSYFRMVYLTTRRMLTNDLVAGIKWAEARAKSEVVLVGHSSGGGLSQDILSKQEVHVKGLALLGAVPSQGSLGVYINWAKLDPWFTVRMLFHGWHSNSPLSHPVLTQRAFFGSKFPLASVIPFQKRINRYESFLWPISMMRPFATPSTVLQQIQDSKQGTAKLLVMAGSEDKLMNARETEDLTALYRSVEKPGSSKVQMEFVEGAGHHLQNDVQWEDGAAKLFQFYQKLVTA